MKQVLRVLIWCMYSYRKMSIVFIDPIDMAKSNNWRNQLPRTLCKLKFKFFSLSHTRIFGSFALFCIWKTEQFQSSCRVSRAMIKTSIKSTFVCVCMCMLCEYEQFNNNIKNCEAKFEIEHITHTHKKAGYQYNQSLSVFFAIINRRNLLPTRSKIL